MHEPDPAKSIYSKGGGGRFRSENYACPVQTPSGSPALRNMRNPSAPGQDDVANVQYLLRLKSFHGKPRYEFHKRNALVDLSVFFFFYSSPQMWTETFLDPSTHLHWNLAFNRPVIQRSLASAWTRLVVVREQDSITMSAHHECLNPAPDRSFFPPRLWMPNQCRMLKIEEHV